MNWEVFYSVRSCMYFSEQVTETNIEAVLATSGTVELYHVMLRLIIKSCDELAPTGSNVVLQVRCILIISIQVRRSCVILQQCVLVASLFHMTRCNSLYDC